MPDRNKKKTPPHAPPTPRFGQNRSYPPFEWPSLTAHVMMRLKPDHDPVAVTAPSVIDARWEARVTCINKAINKFRQTDQDAPEMRFAFPPQLARRGEPDFAHSGKANDKASLPLNASLCVPLEPFGHFRMALIVEVMPEATAFSLRATPMGADNLDTAHLEQTRPAYDVLKTLMDGDAPAGNAADTLLDALYEGFWDAYFDHISGYNAHPGEAARLRLFSAMGETVAEFHGAVLSARRKSAGFETLDDQIAQGEARRQELGARKGNSKVIPPEHDDIDGIRDTLMEFLNKRPVFFSTALKLAALRPPPTSQRTDGNAVLCFLDEGYALYGSTLRMGDDKIVRFFLIYGGVSRHHLGRLVMTLHHCGELRIAGTFDALELSAVSEMIRVADLKLGGQQPTSLARIEKDASDLTKLVRGGLSFRIARLTQHTQLLQHHLTDLHVRRIAGWQSYEGFIRRNISRELEHYVALGPRFDQLQQRIRQVATRQTTEAMAERTRRLVELQVGAEVIGLLAVWYYFATSVAKIAKGHAPHGVYTDLFEANIYVGTLAGVLVARVLIWLGMRTLRARRLTRERALMESVDNE